jgi:hypothetical protein
MGRINFILNYLESPGLAAFLFHIPQIVPHTVERF